MTQLTGKSLPSHLFLQPAVVEVVGAGFDRPSNARYLTLRFPRILKVHLDRSPVDVIGYEEYPRLAQASHEIGDPDAKYRSWLSKLDPESEDDVEAVATPSRSSDSQESALSNKDVSSVQPVCKTGIKRRASSSLVSSSSTKMCRLDVIATTLLGKAHTQRTDRNLSNRDRGQPATC